MASGKSHDRATFYLSIAALCALPISQIFPLQDAIALSAGIYLGGLYLSPDLDLLKSNPTNRWKRLKLAWLWGLYRKFPHRSRYTHTVGVGTALRMLYLCGVVLPVALAIALIPILAIGYLLAYFGVAHYFLLLFFWVSHHMSAIGEGREYLLWFFVAGAEMSSCLHYLMDGLLLPAKSK